MNSPEIELFLAKLYTDDALLARFAADSAAELAAQQLSHASIESLMQVDIQDLLLAAQSYGHKRRELQGIRQKRFTLRRWYQRFFG